MNVCEAFNGDAWRICDGGVEESKPSTLSPRQFSHNILIRRGDGEIEVIMYTGTVTAGSIFVRLYYAA